MAYFVTGATGFIGGQLIPHLLERGETIHALVREGSLERLEERRRKWGVGADRLVAVPGDLSKPQLGLDASALADLQGQVSHFFHLAAVYDMTADAEALLSANVDGTRNAVGLANAIAARHFHHVSSIAAAGRYPGVFREDMFEEAEGLEEPYFRTKHDSEAVVREECRAAWRIYRPGVVVGDSETGEMEKIDGPYYFFKLIKRLRKSVPSWVPLVGIEGGLINLVPVDFVVRALDHIAHQEGPSGQTFHLVDPSPKSVAAAMNDFARAAHAPEFVMRIEVRATRMLPAALRGALTSFPPVRRIVDSILEDFGIPRRVVSYAAQPTRFDCRETTKALAGSGIEVPRLETYAWRLWDYWERHLDPDLGRDRSLAGAIRGKRILVTGASSGIGRATALKAGRAGATVLLVARTAEKLTSLQQEIESAGGSAFVHPADLSDSESCDALVRGVLEQHGGIDVLVNNAGRSIRRSVENSCDRFHDFERTMQLNYFGALRMMFGFLPGMQQRKSGHIVNVSSIGVQTSPPRFSAYVASKSALDAFSRCAASELVDAGVALTTVYMPLVKTEMIAPTKIYDAFPTITAAEAAEMVCGAMVDRPKRVATRLGIFGEIAYAVAPKAVDVILNTAFRIFPESGAALGKKGKGEEVSAEATAFAHLMPGVHW